MASDLHSLVSSKLFSLKCDMEVLINDYIEHTMLVTETGVEVLTARRDDSPGGPIPIPDVAK